MSTFEGGRIPEEYIPSSFDRHFEDALHVMRATKQTAVLAAHSLMVIGGELAGELSLKARPRIARLGESIRKMTQKQTIASHLSSESIVSPVSEPNEVIGKPAGLALLSAFGAVEWTQTPQQQDLQSQPIVYVEHPEIGRGLRRPTEDHVL